MSVTVDYAFGRTMNGVAVVKFKRFSQLVVFEKTIRIGTDNAIFTVHITNDLGVSREELIDIDLEFTDAMTNKKINATSFTHLKSISNTLEFIAAAQFKRNQQFDFTIAAKRYDGAPVIKAKLLLLFFSNIYGFFFRLLKTQT